MLLYFVLFHLGYTIVESGNELGFLRLASAVLRGTLKTVPKLTQYRAHRRIHRWRAILHLNWMRATR